MILCHTILPIVLSLFLGSLHIVARETDVHDDTQIVMQSPLSDTTVSSSTSSAHNATYDTAQPFYMIAHRVLVIQGVRDALKNGANAIEIDMYAKDDGWWADHDDTIGSQGDSALDMFKTIAQARQNGGTVTFVWLDLKNPDDYDPNDPERRKSSIDALRDLAREWLEPAGVRVLYGFYEAKGNAYFSIRDNLSAMEAINLNGQEDEVEPPFEQGPKERAKKVMSYGYFNFGVQFGSCHEDRYYTCTELRMGMESGKFGKVFGWTVSAGQGDYVEKVMNEANVDGLIYGRMFKHYVDNQNTRDTAADITNWVKAHPWSRFMATNDNPPW